MMFHTSTIEISKSALEQNIAFIKSILKNGVQLSSVVKGNAYGHGIEEFVPLAESCGINHFSVFSAEEARRVKESIITKPTIMIMGSLDKDQMAWAIENGIEFFVFNIQRLEEAKNISNQLNRKAIIHIEVETGMNRTGIPVKELEYVISYLKEHSSYLQFKGLCTHYAGAESIANYHRVKHQKKTFKKACRIFEKHNLKPEINHTACSAATIRYPKTQMDMVRIGIMQYGFFPTKEVLIDYLGKTGTNINPLKRLITWTSKVMDIKEVKAGEFIGYGTSYLANRDMNIAVIPVGYYHGFSRSLSNQGRVLINGHRIGVIGMVNMNMLTADITEINDISIGDMVTLIGTQGEQELSVASFSEFANQINYEILARLPESIPRIVKV
ncbi:alanine racemase [Mangrovimonas aestuarii]|uniref:alanine racemase n=1 Tax=Mangrovimonas aestuarii TaxID=3018443 RepID=UPI002377E672|nr:alanine racemase [Mangrovimonas aestuarii]